MLRSSLGSLVKNFGKDEFMYLSQEFPSEVLDLVKKKGFYPGEYVSSFSLLMGNEITGKEYEHIFKV